MMHGHILRLLHLNVAARRLLTQCCDDWSCELCAPVLALDETLSLTVAASDLSVRAKNAFWGLTVGDIVVLKERDLHRRPNVGVKMIEEIKTWLAGLNLSLSDDRWRSDE